MKKILILLFLALINHEVFSIGRKRIKKFRKTLIKVPINKKQVH